MRRVNCGTADIVFAKGVVMRLEERIERQSAKASQSAKVSLGVNWANGIFLIVAHVAAIAAFFFWSWPALITAVVLYWVGGSLGIGMGYHRLLTHRGYKVPKLVEYFLVTCGTLALEGA